VELLVATAIALALMLFVATIFSVFGQAVGEAQDVLRLHDQMRSAAWSLRQDLSGITCPVQPWGRPEADSGYFELIEGPQNDYAGLHGTNTLVSDVDDVLMFTTQQGSGNFVGQLYGKPIESPVAEVAWFCVQGTDTVDNQPIYNLHRRRLLARSYIGTSTTLAAGYDMVSGTIPAIYQSADLSLRNVAGQLLPNGLSDLTKRENRFCHATVFPHAVTNHQTNGILTSGEDVILNNVIAFDVRVFDPQQSPPSYVDLGGPVDPDGPGPLLGFPQPATALTSDPMDPVPANPSLQWSTPTYCTWSEHYEANGQNEDGDVVTDEGTNGSDDSGDGVADDPSELETAPPYNVPLRAIEIRIRCIEPKSKQIRQITVRHSFPQ